jgi:preprotein translocase subunit YajC
MAEPTIVNVPTSNGNGSKAFAGILAILAVVAGIYAVTKPTSQRIDTVEAMNGAVAKDLEKHEAVLGHPGMVAQLAAITEKFVEIETQFDAARHQIDDLRGHKEHCLAWNHEHDRRVLPLNARQTEEIKELQRNVFGRSQRDP